jgi:hypothetical protein
MNTNIGKYLLLLLLDKYSPSMLAWGSVAKGACSFWLKEWDWGWSKFNRHRQASLIA